MTVNYEKLQAEADQLKKLLEEFESKCANIKAALDQRVKYHRQRLALAEQKVRARRRAHGKEKT